MSLAINIENSHTVTVSNIRTVDESPPTNPPSGVVSVIDTEGVATITVAMSAGVDNSELIASIPPTALVEGATYFLRVQVIADGATMTGQTSFVAAYRCIGDGVF